MYSFLFGVIVGMAIAAFMIYETKEDNQCDTVEIV